MQSVYCKTPYCGLKITQLDNNLHGLDFTDQLITKQQIEDPLLRETITQIQQYVKFSNFYFDLPLNPQGTEFQQKVWSVLRAIPSGQVKTYGEIATEINSSARAVGNACRNNPIPLIIPCHRVVSAQGLGGFVGQTQGPKISIKHQLLLHEGVEI